MWYITYNDVVTPQSYITKEDAIRELQKTFAGIELDKYDVAYWPNVSARGHTKIEIKNYYGEIE